jgi:putative membrane protein
MRGRVWAAVAFLCCAGAASAHADGIVTPDAVWQSWTFDPLVLVPLLIAHWLYGRGWLRLRRRERSKAALFLAGELALVAALVSPIDALGEMLLSMHMVQHMLLVAVAPPLLLLGQPARTFVAALPGQSMAGLAKITIVRRLLAGLAFLTRLIPATIIHALALWLWHVPPAFEAALHNDFAHTLEHFSFFGSALLFWYAVLRSGRVQRTALAGALAAFVTFLHGGLLGGILSLAPVPLYPGYGDRPLVWGLDLLTDQQLAGAIMWVPIGPAYLAAALWLLFKVLKTRDAPA